VFFLGLRDTHFYAVFRCLAPEIPAGLELDTEDPATSSLSVRPERWTHVAATFTWNADSTNRVTLFVDGREVNRSGDIACAPLEEGSRNPINVGADVNGCAAGVDCPPDNDWIDGVLDEIRIERDERSQTDYRSMTDQLLTYGPITRVDR
jgi:Concanavalin A-like lectin/glucanases superfamily